MKWNQRKTRAGAINNRKPLLGIGGRRQEKKESEDGDTWRRIERGRMLEGMGKPDWKELCQP